MDAQVEVGGVDLEHLQQAVLRQPALLAVGDAGGAVGQAGPGVIDQDAAHHRRDDGEELTAVQPGRMMLRNDFYRNGTLAARVTSTAGWFDLKNRKLVCPPPNLAKPLHDLARTDDFVVLKPSA